MDTSQAETGLALSSTPTGALGTAFVRVNMF